MLEYEETFWTEAKDNNGNVRIDIDQLKLLDFCSSELGFYNYVDYAGSYNLVQVIDKSIIREARIEDLKQQIKRFIRSTLKREDIWEKFVQQDYFTNNFIHLMQTIDNINFNMSSKEEAHFYYRNGVVVISKTRQEIIPYNGYKGYVWEKQIKGRDFTPTSCYTDCEFARFLKNVSGNDKDRFLALISIIGYTLHPYKDPSNAKAVILIDENVDFSGAAHGGTGKSLIAKAIQQIVPTSWKDGKKYNPNETFAFDDIRPYHRVLYFDDVKAGFQFEEFYSFITGDIQVKRKYKDSAIIPFSLAPKLMVSSNHLVMGTGGGTDERRRVEFEVAPYYSLALKPSDEFGHNFFVEWDMKEWQSFDTMMLSFVRFYLKNGLIEPTPINIKENKLKAATNPCFIEFMDGNHELEHPLDKSELFKQYQFLYNDRNLTPIHFKKWIDIWAQNRNIHVRHYKSSSRAMVIFNNKSK